MTDPKIEPASDSELQRWAFNDANLSRTAQRMLIARISADREKLAADGELIRELAEALKECEVTFREYANIHFAKPNGEGDVKGRNNLEIARGIQALLAKVEARR